MESGPPAQLELGQRVALLTAATALQTTFAIQLLPLVQMANSWQH